MSDPRHNSSSTKAPTLLCHGDHPQSSWQAYRIRGNVPARKIGRLRISLQKSNPDRRSGHYRSRLGPKGVIEPAGQIATTRLNCIVQRRSRAEQSKHGFPGNGGHLRPGENGVRTKNANTELRFDSISFRWSKKAKATAKAKALRGCAPAPGFLKTTRHPLFRVFRVGGL